MRSEWSNLVGRDHLSFRSYYVPIKVNCVQLSLATTIISFFFLSLSLVCNWRWFVWDLQFPWSCQAARDSSWSWPYPQWGCKEAWRLTNKIRLLRTKPRAHAQRSRFSRYSSTFFPNDYLRLGNYFLMWPHFTVSPLLVSVKTQYEGIVNLKLPQGLD